MPENPTPTLTEATRDEAPAWLNLDAFIDEQLIADLASARAEAEALAPAVRELAIRSYRATSAFESALARANLPDEAWEMAKDACGAGATFEALRRLIDDLRTAELEDVAAERGQKFRLTVETREPYVCDATGVAYTGTAIVIRGRGFVAKNMAEVPELVVSPEALEGVLRQARGSDN